MSRLPPNLGGLHALQASHNGAAWKSSSLRYCFPAKLHERQPSAFPCWPFRPGAAEHAPVLDGPSQPPHSTGRSCESPPLLFPGSVSLLSVTRNPLPDPPLVKASLLIGKAAHAAQPDEGASTCHKYPVHSLVVLTPCRSSRSGSLTLSSSPAGTQHWQRSAQGPPGMPPALFSSYEEQICMNRLTGALCPLLSAL